MFLSAGDDPVAQLTRLTPDVTPGAIPDAHIWDVSNVSLLDRQLVVLSRDEEVGPMSGIHNYGREGEDRRIPTGTSN